MMPRWAPLLALLVVANSALAQNAVQRSLIPVAGDRVGFSGTHWRTSIVLFNETSKPIDAVITAIGYDDAFLIVTVGAGESYSFDDQTLGLAGRLYALEVSSLGPYPLRIAAAAYGFRDGRASEAQPIPVLSGDPSPSATLIAPIRFDDETRANLGIANLEDQPVAVTFAVRKIATRNLATTTIVIPPRTLFHAPIQAYFPLLPNGSGLSIIVEAGGRRVISYGSVVENETNSAEFLLGVPTIP